MSPLHRQTAVIAVTTAAFRERDSCLLSATGVSFSLSSVPVVASHPPAMAEVTAEASDSNHQGQGDAVIQQQEQDQEEQVCFICDTSITDPDALGEWFRTELTSRKTGPLTIHCHYFCLLFSCNLKQMGKEDEGIRGFLAEDIERERHRGRQLTCYFCHKSGPTSACCEKSCKVAYHLPCAVYSRKEMEKLVPADFFKGTTSKEVSSENSASYCNHYLLFTVKEIPCQTGGLPGSGKHGNPLRRSV